MPKLGKIKKSIKDPYGKDIRIGDRVVMRVKGRYNEGIVTSIQFKDEMAKGFFERHDMVEVKDWYCYDAFPWQFAFSLEVVTHA